jgi:transposase
MDALLFVGIDVAKDRLDVHVRPVDEAFAVARDGEGLADLVSRLGALKPQLVALEATGGFETVVVAALAALKLPVVVVNPAQVRAYARSLGLRAKTDPIDAAVIARFAEATRPEPRPLANEESLRLADLTARRRQIIQMIVAEKQREQRASAMLKRSIARLLKALQKELSVLDHDIDTAVRGSPAWREKEDLLASVPGVGSAVARTLIAELPELGTLTRRKIASLAGLAPYTQRSGKWRGKSFIAAGRPAPRAALFMAALSASRFNPALRSLHQRLLARGKEKKVALIAVARKLLTILNAIIRTKTPWQYA